jgi:hypothetical protein
MNRTRNKRLSHPQSLALAGYPRRSAASVIRETMMRKSTFQTSIFTLLLLLAGVCFGQGKTETVTISDPAPVSLKALFEKADIVAFIKIHSGDAESYKQVLYKAEVLNAYKGIKEKEIIYFAPFIGYGVGEEYLVFLKKAEKRIGEIVDESVKPNPSPYDATQIFYRIMYEGYSIMPISYECFFDGKDSDKCDYGVKFNTYQVELPATLKTFPKDVGEFSPDKRWVRRKAVEAALVALKNNRK